MRSPYYRWMTQVKSGPVWYEGLKVPHFPTLAHDLETDVVVVGGGLTGLLSAYVLSKAGKKVIVLEKCHLGDGATGMTTGFLTSYIDTNLTDLIAAFGREKTAEVVASHERAIDLIEKIVDDEHIECDFMRCESVVYAAPGRDSQLELFDEFKAARSFQMQVERIDKRGYIFKNNGALRFKNQAKFHPLKFLFGLATRLRDMGVQIFENTEVTAVIAETEIRANALGHVVLARHAVLATYEPFKEPAGLYFKKAMYRTYIIQYELDQGLLPYGTYEDTENPYHYFRVDADGLKDRLILGGADHRLDIPVSRTKNFKAIEEYEKRMLDVIPHKETRRWSGPILEPIDGLAFIGPYGDPRMLYAFGFSGNGMTYAGIAAMMFRDTILGRKNRSSSVYDVGRIPGARSLVIKGCDYLGELLGGALKNTLNYSNEESKKDEK